MELIQWFGVIEMYTQVPGPNSQGHTNTVPKYACKHASGEKQETVWFMELAYERRGIGSRIYKLGSSLKEDPSSYRQAHHYRYSRGS
jgi:hypothetical protein